jgi:spore maturation protein SpmB
MSQPAFDFQEITTRIVKYIMEGAAVGIVATILPSNPLKWQEAVILAIVAASMFAILDALAPSIGASLRQGAGLGMGFKLVKFGM